MLFDQDAPHFNVDKLIMSKVFLRVVYSAMEGGGSQCSGLPMGSINLVVSPGAIPPGVLEEVQQQ